ncbi:DedA family protein [Gorillibacterium massiliense]|uniref:DedA family protein n=1 Tax=Gorillibacterium massiliense TaxID=1280390 RepID=UPI0004BBE873|nr:DedA family protein [Gorillibacterium massiliense]
MNISDIERLFEGYGYFVLICGLLLEFIGLPFPGETTLTYSGYLSYKGVLHLAPVLILSFLATTIGMTLTYLIGKAAGMPFIKRYGKWLFLTPSKIDATRRWFDKYGTNLLLIGYFIPGVRHFTGYFSGIIGLRFRSFAVYTYLGAAFWVVSFAFLGHALGPQWKQLFILLEENAGLLIAAAAGLFIILLAIRTLMRMGKSTS